MKNKFDVLVIGSGPGGSKAAMDLQSAGKKVAIIDMLFGGTCALKGCTPKKAMETVTSTYWNKKNLETKGFSPSTEPLNWTELVTHQKHFTELVPKNTIEKFEDKGIVCIQGKAKFIDEKTLDVEGIIYTAKTIIIATGATESPLKFKGASHLKTSFDFFRLVDLPEHITFIGAGYIAFELSHIAAACGRKVTILNDSENFLTQFSSDFAHKMLHATLDKGIDVKLGCKIKSLAKSENSFSISYTVEGEDEKKSFETGIAFHSAGRVPALKELEIEKANLSLNKRKGLKLNKHYQAVNNKHIYGIGDVTGDYQFTEIAGYDASIAIHNILHPKKLKKGKIKGMPDVLFTNPKLASVGKSKKELKKKKVTTKSGDLTSSLTQRAINNKYAAYKIHSSKKGKILGAEVMGYKADDMINIIAIAIQTNMPFKKLNNLLLAYPTATHDVKTFH